MGKQTLYLFTDRFPFGSHETFLDEEIAYLARHFCVTLVPCYVEAGYPTRTLPTGVEIDRTLAGLMHKRFRNHAWLKVVWAALFSKHFYKEISRQSKSPEGLTFEYIKRTISCISQAEITFRWYKHKFTQLAPLAEAAPVFLTYWFWGQTLGLAFAKSRLGAKFKLLSRAHGFDLYEDRYASRSIPFRAETFEGLDHVYCISENGQKHLQKSWPNRAISVSRLGAGAASNLNPRADAGRFVIVSCSSIIDLKRIDRIVNALEQLPFNKINKRIEWYHFGDGPLRAALEQKARTQFSGLPLQYEFKGFQSRAKILEFYSTAQVDLFINTSLTEGIPYSIMEAFSRGIPAAAPMIGGLPEIVSSLNGLPLANPDNALAVAKAIGDFAQLSLEQAERYRNNAYTTWQDKFTAEVNFTSFAQNILTAVPT